LARKAGSGAQVADLPVQDFAQFLRELINGKGLADQIDAWIENAVMDHVVNRIFNCFRRRRACSASFAPLRSGTAQSCERISLVTSPSQGKMSDNEFKDKTIFRRAI
jgi:hypothetical protein